MRRHEHYERLHYECLNVSVAKRYYERSLYVTNVTSGGYALRAFILRCSFSLVVLRAGARAYVTARARRHDDGLSLSFPLNLVISSLSLRPWNLKTPLLDLRALEYLVIALSLRRWSAFRGIFTILHLKRGYKGG